MVMEALGLELQTLSPEAFAQLQVALAIGDTSLVSGFV